MGGGAVGEAHSYTWTFAICPTRIEIDLSVISELQQDLASTSVPQQGLLYGSTHPGSTEIHGLEFLVAFGRDEFARAKSTARREVLGCYLIREGSSFLLSDSEINLIRELFCDPQSVVLLIERRENGPAEGTFFFWRGEAFVYNLPVPFPIDAAMLADAGDMRSTVEASPLPAQRNFGYPAFRMRRRGHWRLIAAVLLMAVAGFGGRWLLTRPKPERATAANRIVPEAAAPSEPAGPRDDLEISWDPREAAVSTATAGVLQIDDGGLRRQIPLALTELRFGKVLYTPASDQVRVELAIRLPDGSTRQTIALAHPAPSTRASTAEPESEPVPPPPVEKVEKAEVKPAPLPPAPVPAAPAPTAPVSAAPLTAAPPAPEVTADRRAPLKQFSVESARVPARVPDAPAILDPQHVLPSYTAPVGALAAKLPAALAARTLPPPPRAAARSGRLIWIGTLPRRGVVEVEGNTASVGSLKGGLPGAPVSLSIFPAEFAGNGLEVYITDASRHNRTEPPSAGNGWNRITYVWDPERVKQLVVLEAPNASNRFNRLALRSDARRCSMILIDWATK